MIPRFVSSGASMLAAAVIAACQYDPYTWEYAEVKPEAQDLLGTWTASYCILGDGGRKELTTPTPAIRILLDGGLEMEHMPEEWRSDVAPRANAGNIAGNWQLKLHRRWWSIYVKLDAVACAGCLMVLDDDPPHRLWLQHGDPDAARGCEFRRDPSRAPVVLQ